MQGHLGSADTRSVELVQQGLIKMKSGCGRRYSAVSPTIESLITFSILWRVIPLNVGRQRHVTESSHHVFY